MAACVLPGYIPSAPGVWSANQAQDPHHPSHFYGGASQAPSAAGPSSFLLPNAFAAAAAAAATMQVPHPFCATSADRSHRDRSADLHHLLLPNVAHLAAAPLASSSSAAALLGPSAAPLFQCPPSTVSQRLDLLYMTQQQQQQQEEQARQAVASTTSNKSRQAKEETQQRGPERRSTRSHEGTVQRRRRVASTSTSREGKTLSVRKQKPAPALLQPGWTPVTTNVITTDHLDMALNVIKRCWPCEKEWAQTASSSSSGTTTTTSVHNPEHVPLADFVRVLVSRSHASLATLQLALYYAVKAWSISLDEERMQLSMPDFVPITSSSSSYPYDENSNAAFDAWLLESGHLFGDAALPVSDLCARRTFLVSLILANKFLQDKSYSNRAWASITDLAANQISTLERDLLNLLAYDLAIPDATMLSWVALLQGSIVDNNAASQHTLRIKTTASLAALSSSASSSCTAGSSKAAQKEATKRKRSDRADEEESPKPPTQMPRQWLQQLSPPTTPDPRCFTRGSPVVAPHDGQHANPLVPAAALHTLSNAAAAMQSQQAQRGHHWLATTPFASSFAFLQPSATPNLSLPSHYPFMSSMHPLSWR